MKIFIWNSHGNTQVYAAETVTQLHDIINEICALLSTWAQMERKIAKVATYTTKYSDHPDKLERSVKYLIDEVGVGTNEYFEVGTGFSTLKNIE